MASSYLSDPPIHKPDIRSYEWLSWFRQLYERVDGQKDHGYLQGLTDDDHTQYLLADGTRALTGNWEAGDYRINSRWFIAGEQGSEGSGISINGTTYDSHLRVSDINDNAPAEFILHRHSTTYPAALIGSRSYSNGNSHGNVADTYELLSIVGTGWHTSTYYPAARIDFVVDGTPGAADMPGAIVFRTNPDGSANLSPTERMRIGPDGSVKLGTDGFIRFDEHSSAPSTPASGNVILYAKADGYLYSKDDAGTETQLGGGGSGTAGWNEIFMMMGA